ncbi:MAG: DUF5996 family protein [Acidimicrobiia bacterium]
MIFEELSPDREPTRAALHSYAHAATTLNRVHGIAHPKWWHVSLKPRPSGLVADPIPLPAGGALEVRLDLVRHAVAIESNTGPVAEFPMGDGATGSEMGDRILAVAAELGLEGSYDRSKFESDEATEYDPADASALMATFLDASAVFERRRVSVEGSVGPIQLWPHGFDLAYEWFGTRTEPYEEDGKTTQLPSQINLGFYPQGRSYFYSNPWPFEESLLAVELPHGGEWNTEGWQGSILYHDQLAGDPAAATKLEEFAKAVFDAAAPTLTV